MNEQIIITPSKQPFASIDINSPFMTSQQKDQKQITFHTPIKNSPINHRISNSKFYSQSSPHFNHSAKSENQNTQEEPIRIRTIEQAEELLKQFANYELPVVVQDIVKHFYIFQNIKLLCVYPISRIDLLTNLISYQNLNKITLIVSQNCPKIDQITILHNLKQLTNHTQGIFHISFQYLHMREQNENQAILNEHKYLNTVIYNFELDKSFLFPLLNIKSSISQLVLLNQVLTLYQMKELKNWLSFDTNYFGPLVELSKNVNEQTKEDYFKKKQIEYYRPNYILKPTLFLERVECSRQEMLLKIIKDLTNQEINHIIVKLENVQEVNEMDLYLSKNNFEVYTISNKQEGYSNKMINLFTKFNGEILLTQSMSNLHPKLIKSCNILVQLDMPSSITEYLNDSFYLDEQSNQIVLVSREDYLKKKNEIESQRFEYWNLRTQIESLLQLEEDSFLSRSKLVRFKDIENAFMNNEEESKKVLHLLATNDLIQLNRIIPKKCSFEMDKNKPGIRDDMDILLNEFLINSRKCIGNDGYESELKDDQKLIEILLEKTDKIKFWDWYVEYKIIEEDEEKIEFIIRKLDQMKKQEKEELDLFYCMGLSQSKQTNIKDLILNLKDYLGSEYRVATQEYFNDFNNLIPKCSELGSHKEKNVLGKDIQQIMKEYGDKCNLQVIRQVLLGIRNKRKNVGEWICKDIWGKYKSVNTERLEQEIKKQFGKQWKQQQQCMERQQGWVQQRKKRCNF